MSAKPNFILIGPPGSGKSTLANFFVAKLGLRHIDIGSELRRAASENTPFAEEINNTIHHKQELVSDMVVYGVLAQVLMQIPDDQGIVLDGAPRPVTQVDEVLHILKVAGRQVSKVIFINLSEAESIRRISSRFKCETCDANLVLGRDVVAPENGCPHCRGKVSQRADDTIEGVKKRYEIFQQVILPTVEYFRKAKLLVEVDGSQTAEEVFQSVMQALENSTKEA